MAARITFFEVPPDADEAFLAAWAQDGAGQLWRALRDDVALRFVAVEQAEDGEYELTAEAGRNEVAGGVLLVQAVDDPDAWAAEDLTGHRGFLGRRLYHSRDDGEHLGMARWSSPLMIQRARQSGTVYGSS